MTTVIKVYVYLLLREWLRPRRNRSKVVLVTMSSSRSSRWSCRFWNHWRMATGHSPVIQKVHQAQTVEEKATGRGIKTRPNASRVMAEVLDMWHLPLQGRRPSGGRCHTIRAALSLSFSPSLSVAMVTVVTMVTGERLTFQVSEGGQPCDHSIVQQVGSKLLQLGLSVHDHPLSSRATCLHV